MSKFRFENLQVWQDARRFVSKIYSITNKFPGSEKFSLVDQLRRAAVSIALNIAEGSDRKSDIEFARYLRMAISSTEEVVTALFIALDQKYLNQSDFDKLYEETHMIVAKLNALIRSLKTAAVVGSRKTVDKTNGFTLIELLVAISIIVILSTIGLITYTGTQAKARDSVRKADLGKLALALEGYFQKNGKYVPPQEGAETCQRDTDKFYLDIVPFVQGSVPKDPKDQTNYCYISINGGASYRLFSKLENCQDQDIISSIDCSTANYNFSLVSDNLPIAAAPN